MASHSSGHLAGLPDKSSTCQEPSGNASNDDVGDRTAVKRSYDDFLDQKAIPIEEVIAVVLNPSGSESEYSEAEDSETDDSEADDSEADDTEPPPACQNKELARRLDLWLDQIRYRGDIVTGLQMFAQTDILAAEMGMQNFKCNTEWLHAWIF